MNTKIYSVFDSTRNVRIADRTERAGSIWKRMKGLIGKSAEDFGLGSGLWIIPSEGIHTFGMRFPIDAVYLDSKGKVIRLYKNLSPNRIGAVKFGAQSVLELPAGTLTQTRVEVGDILDFRIVDDRET